MLAEHLTVVQVGERFRGRRVEEIIAVDPAVVSLQGGVVALIEGARDLRSITHGSCCPWLASD